MHQDVAAISISQLTKRYGAVTALDRIDLDVPNGVTYGFLGPNGAGKTTAIRVLMGFIRPSAGQARIHGCDCWREGVRARANLGFLVPADALYPEMTGAALLDYLGALSGRPPILRVPLLEALELSRADLGRRLCAYSKGMKQKLALTAAMQTAPALIILDEPTDGLDPLIQRAFEHVLTDVRRQGCTIFMSSHDLTEVERTCERVAIIREGRIVAEESIAELRARHHRTVEVTFAGEPPAGLDEIPGCRGGSPRRQLHRPFAGGHGQSPPALSRRPRRRVRSDPGPPQSGKHLPRLLRHRVASSPTRLSSRSGAA